MCDLRPGNQGACVSHFNHAGAPCPCESSPLKLTTASNCLRITIGHWLSERLLAALIEWLSRLTPMPGLGVWWRCLPSCVQ